MKPTLGLMSHNLRKGDFVIWKWASGYSHGQIVSIDTGYTEIEFRGEVHSRIGSKDDPAVTIVDHNNRTVLRLASELELAT